MKILRFTIRCLILIAHLLIGLTVAGLWFHRKNRDYQQHKSIVRIWLKLCALILGCKIQLSTDSAQTPRDIEGSLFVANHISWLDIFVLGGLFNLRFLSKHEIRQWPLLGWLSASSGTLFIQRGKGSEQSADKIKQALQARDNVMVFPESTTTDGVSVKPFHPRLLKSAIELEKPITPVMISYRTDQRVQTEIA